VFKIRTNRLHGNSRLSAHAMKGIWLW